MSIIESTIAFLCGVLGLALIIFIVKILFNALPLKRTKGGSPYFRKEKKESIKITVIH
ncbi:MAG: hypothetical protein ACOX2O_04930 [Bdellovibrionota bacterium]